MSTSEATKGPWRVHPDSTAEVIGADDYHVASTSGPHLHVDHDGNHGHWATTPGAHRDQEEAEEDANARLIASAPALFAACEAAVKSTHLQAYQPETWEQVRAALARARGEAE